MTSFPNTARALAVYDAEQVRLNRQLDRAKTDADVKTWLAADNEAMRQVRLAFFEDTKTFNSLSACMVTPISHLRELVTQS